MYRAKEQLSLNDCEIDPKVKRKFIILAISAAFKLGCELKRIEILNNDIIDLQNKFANIQIYQADITLEGLQVISKINEKINLTKKKIVRIEAAIHRIREFSYLYKVDEKGEPAYDTPIIYMDTNSHQVIYTAFRCGLTYQELLGNPQMKSELNCQTEEFNSGLRRLCISLNGLQISPYQALPSLNTDFIKNKPVY